MKNLFKNPKTRARNVILVVLPFVIIAGVCLFLSYKSLKSMASSDTTSTVTYKDSIDGYDYHLRTEATNYQEELFHELQDAINDGTDEAKTATLVAENFVADFYTLSNKAGTYDVGGMYYVFNEVKNNFYYAARDGFYKYLTYYIDTYGSENLLEVTNINVAEASTEPGSYVYDGVTYKSFFVSLDIEYKNANTLTGVDIVDPNGNEDNTTFADRLYILVIENENGRFEIAQMYGN